MSSKKLKQFVKKRFRFFCFFSCCRDMLRTFINILIPVLLSKIIADAAMGNIREVLVLTGAVLLIKLFEFIVFCVSDNELKKNLSVNKHICKLEFYKFFFERPVHELFSLKAGETKEKLNDDFETITKKYTSTYPQTITAFLSAAAYLVYLLSLSKWIALIFFAFSMLQVIPPIVIRKYLQVNYDNCRDIEAELTDFVVGGYRAFLLIKLYKLDIWWKKKLAGLHREYSKIGRKSIYTGTAESVLNDIVNSVLTYVTYGLIGWLVLKSIVTLEVGVQAIAVSGSVFGLVRTMFQVIRDVAVSRAAERRISDSPTAAETEDARISAGNISISDLSFSYDDNELISNLNLSIDNPKISVIKGKNGSGKTTLLYLIAGVLKGNAGEVRIDGFSSLELTASNYPGELFFLPQEDAVFNFTAMELFGMMFPGCKDKVLEMAESFGLSRALLLESKISELSGGERKKVFLAAAFAVDPVLMILDEPTNSLDNGGKALLKELLNQREGRTLLVTHDVFLDDIAEHIYVIDKGANDEDV